MRRRDVVRARLLALRDWSDHHRRAAGRRSRKPTRQAPGPGSVSIASVSYEPLTSGRPSREGRPSRAWLAQPGLQLAAGVVLAVVSLHLWIDPSNPPGFHRDEASIAYNASTISASLRDEHGGLLPLYIESFGDYKSPVFVYALAGVFRLTGPSSEVARGLGAVGVLAAVLLLGLLALRRTRDIRVAAAIVALGGLSPWLFELGRVAVEVTLEPLVFIVLLLVLEACVAHEPLGRREWRRRWWNPRALGVHIRGRSAARTAPCSSSPRLREARAAAMARRRLGDVRRRS